MLRTKLIEVWRRLSSLAMFGTAVLVASGVSMGQVSVPLEILDCQQWTEAGGNANHVQGYEDHFSDILATCSLHESDSSGGTIAECNALVDARLIHGSVGATVFGVNTTSSGIGNVNALFGGNAGVMTHSSTYVQSKVLGTGVASGTLGSMTTGDDLVGTQTYSYISRNGQMMAEIYGSGGQTYGYQTEIQNGQEVVVWFGNQSAGFSFFVDANDIIVQGSLNGLAGSSVSQGSGMGSYSSLEDYSVMGTPSP